METKTLILNKVPFNFVRISAGEFLMGSQLRYSELEESPVRKVQITKDFYMMDAPVTQEQWKTIIGKNPSHFRGENRPVEMVSWNDCQEFCQKVNSLQNELVVRFPTEAEWEYACRAGTIGDFGDKVCSNPDGFDKELDKIAWFNKNSNGQTHDVKQKKSNAWGLYDMHGNVWEWCQDVWDEKAYEKLGNVDPVMSGKGEYRVVRGGSWGFSAGDCRAAYRDCDEPGFRWSSLGFRLAAGLSISMAQKESKKTETSKGLRVKKITIEFE